MQSQLETLKARLTEQNANAQIIQARAEEEKRDLTTEEAAELDGYLAAFDRTKADIDRLEKLGSQSEVLGTGPGRKTAPDQPSELEDDGAGGVIRQPSKLSGGSATFPAGLESNARYRVLPKSWGFLSFGDYAMAVKNSSIRGAQIDRRIAVAEQLASASTYGSEASGSDGGFAIPPDFRSAIMQTVMGEDSLLSRCDQVTCDGNTFTCPVDETTPWQSSGGILANWDAEASAATQSKPALGERTVKLNKLRVLVPMTDELLSDASALDSYLRKKAPEKINFKVNQAIISGTGVGQPLGLLNAPSLVTVTKETSQVTSTIVGNNIIKMFARMYGPCRSKAVWLYNQEIEPQLFKLSLPGTDNAGNAVTGWGSLVYMPPGGLSSAPYGTIYGRPAIPTQACPALSSAGDIIFADLSQYLAILKSGPNPKVDTSIHLWFDQDIVAFKFVLRMGGTQWWSTTAAALNGSNTYSPFVALGAR